MLPFGITWWTSCDTFRKKWTLSHISQTLNISLPLTTPALYLRLHFHRGLDSPFFHWGVPILSTPLLRPLHYGPIIPPQYCGLDLPWVGFPPYFPIPGMAPVIGPPFPLPSFSGMAPVFCLAPSSLSSYSRYGPSYCPPSYSFMYLCPMICCLGLPHPSYLPLVPGNDLPSTRNLLNYKLDFASLISRTRLRVVHKVLTSRRSFILPFFITTSYFPIYYTFSIPCFIRFCFFTYLGHHTTSYATQYTITLLVAMLFGTTLPFHPSQFILRHTSLFPRPTPTITYLHEAYNGSQCLVTYLPPSRCLS
jgi:hypothetical protein